MIPGILVSTEWPPQLDRLSSSAQVRGSSPIACLSPSPIEGFSSARPQAPRGVFRVVGEEPGGGERMPLELGGGLLLVVGHQQRHGVLAAKELCFFIP